MIILYPVSLAGPRPLDGPVSFDFVFDTLWKFYEKLLIFWNLAIEPINDGLPEMLQELGMTENVSNVVTDILNFVGIGQLSILGVVLYIIAGYVIVQLVGWFLRLVRL